jgi:hypothetical protein
MSGSSTSPELLEYWWNYNNTNLKLLQVRFYEAIV